MTGLPHHKIDLFTLCFKLQYLTLHLMFSYSEHKAAQTLLPLQQLHEAAFSTQWSES